MHNKDNNRIYTKKIIIELTIKRQRSELNWLSQDYEPCEKPILLSARCAKRDLNPKRKKLSCQILNLVRLPFPTFAQRTKNHIKIIYFHFFGPPKPLLTFITPFFSTFFLFFIILFFLFLLPFFVLCRLLFYFFFIYNIIFLFFLYFIFFVFYLYL